MINCSLMARDVTTRSAQPTRQPGVAATSADRADGFTERAATTHQHDEALGPCDRRVEQVALEHLPGARRERDDHAGVFAPLAPMNAESA